MPPEVQAHPPTAKEIVADENQVRAALPLATDGPHAKLLEDAYEKLRTDIKRVGKPDADKLLSEVYALDKGKTPLIKSWSEGLAPSDDASSKVWAATRDFGNEIAALKIDEQWSKTGKGSFTENAANDALKIGAMNNGTLDTFIAHLQDATQRTGLFGAVAFTNAVNQQLEEAYKNKKIDIPYQIDGPMYSTCACDQLKPGQYGSFNVALRVPKDLNHPDGLAKLYERKY